jgi:hypothetical protein
VMRQRGTTGDGDQRNTCEQIGLHCISPSI